MSLFIGRGMNFTTCHLPDYIASNHRMKNNSNINCLDIMYRPVFWCKTTFRALPQFSGNKPAHMGPDVRASPTSPDTRTNTRQWVETGFGLIIRFTDHSQMETASNYSAIVNQYNPQVTQAHAKSSQSALTSCFMVTDLNSLLCSHPYRPANVSQLTHCSNCRLSTNCSGYNISARTAQKTPFLRCFQFFP
jgi:hypothetical protein